MSVIDNILPVGSILTNTELYKKFACGNSSGMRKSNKLNALIIVCDHTKSLYDDRWSNGVLFYTGMGKEGDQSLNYSRNNILNKSNENGVTLYLFEVFEKNKYLFQGVALLTDKPFQEYQIDSKKNIRKVWIFPLALKQGSPILPEEEVQEKLLFDAISRTSNKLTNKELKKLVENKQQTTTIKVSLRSTTTRPYRDPNIVLYALRRSNGICELCETKAPFITKQGVPFLEVHHIKYLSKGGEDLINNVSALCPNCHRKVHALESKKTVQLLLAKAARLLD